VHRGDASVQRDREQREEEPPLVLGVGIGIGIGSGLGLGLGLASRHDIVGRPAPFGEHEPPPPRHRCRRRLRQVPSQPALLPSRAPTHVHTFMCAHRRFASSAGLSRANIPTLQTRTTSSATSRRRACTATLPTCVRACVRSPQQNALARTRMRRGLHANPQVGSTAPHAVRP
jgi:hypothetical protein